MRAFIEPIRAERPERSALCWRTLHRTAAVSALVTALCLPIQVVVFLRWPPPLEGGVTDWFALLQAHRTAGLIDLDLLLVADNVLFVPILLASYVLMRGTRPSVMILALAWGITSVAMYIATNPALQLAALSDQYAASATDAGRTVIAAAGTALLESWQGTAFHTGYLLGSGAGILLGVAMLRDATFGRPAGVLAIAANVAALGLYIPAIGVIVAVSSVALLEAWYVVIAWRLHRLDGGSA